MTDITDTATVPQTWDATTRQDLLTALKTLKQNGPSYTRCGICTNLDLSDHHTELFKDLAKTWPLHSGAPAYPIPSSTLLSPADTYATNRTTLWTGEQGKLRQSLLVFVIQSLEGSP